MYKNSFIRNIISGLLLLVFTFSITPKEWLHDIVFNHKDTYTKCTDGNLKSHFHTAGFHCDIDNIVVLSPFVFDVKPVDLIVPLLYSFQYVKSINNFCSEHYFYSDLRGPPANI